MIQGIIFDLGNTLMYFTGDWGRTNSDGVERMCNYLAERGYPVPVSFAENFIQVRESGRRQANDSNVEYTTEQALNDTLAMHNICWIPDAILPHAVARFYDAEDGQWVAYADARATLQELRDRGLKLALLSNAMDHGAVMRMVERGNLTEFFDPLMSSAQLTWRKPDPRAFQPILNAWQVPPNELLMVGDVSSYDIVGAHRSGMSGVLIQDRWDTPVVPHAPIPEAELRPDAVITQLSELPALIDRLNAQVEPHQRND